MTDTYARHLPSFENYEEDGDGTGAENTFPPRPRRLIFVLLNLIVPALIALLFSQSGVKPGLALLVWIFLLLYTLLIVIAFQPAMTRKKTPELHMVTESERPPVINDVMNVNVGLERGGIRIFKGRLKDTPARVYGTLKQAFSRTAVPLVQEDQDAEAAIILMPGRIEKEISSADSMPWINWILFALTFVTTTVMGGVHAGFAPGEAAGIIHGLPYSLGLLAILGFHELGHYFTARRYRMWVTPPYFIPAPLWLGTFGAFIKLKSPAENRQNLFDVAVAGPLAGLVVAIPALMIGLHESVLVPGVFAEGTAGTPVASSILFAVLSKLSFGSFLNGGCLIQLSPLAFAGWIGLYVTALNLMPIGQLDGGHIMHALFGSRWGETLSRAAMWSLFLIAVFFLPTLILWAFIVFIIAGRRAAPPLDDMTPLPTARRLLGYFAFAVFLAIILPLPQAFRGAAGIACP